MNWREGDRISEKCCTLYFVYLVYGEDFFSCIIGERSMVSESGHRLDSGSPFWRIQLDQDLLDTISAIYPEWFKVSLLLSPPPPPYVCNEGIQVLVPA